MSTTLERPITGTIAPTKPAEMPEETGAPLVGTAFELLRWEGVPMIEPVPVIRWAECEPHCPACAAAIEAVARREGVSFGELRAAFRAYVGRCDCSGPRSDFIRGRLIDRP